MSFAHFKFSINKVILFNFKINQYKCEVLLLMPTLCKTVLELEMYIK